jgi:hypothetical protein
MPHIDLCIYILSSENYHPIIISLCSSREKLFNISKSWHRANDKMLHAFRLHEMSAKLVRVGIAEMFGNLVIR